MKERLVLLISDISADEIQIDQIYQKLSAFKDPPSDPEQVIIVGYYLHNLYTAFEHICTLVARAFENQVPDRDQWHSLLLRRMTQNIEGIRPRLFSDQVYDYLDELRRFRHVFRSAYSTTLDPVRLALVFRKAQSLEQSYKQDLEKFKGFLNSL